MIVGVGFMVHCITLAIAPIGQQTRGRTTIFHGVCVALVLFCSVVLIGVLELTGAGEDLGQTGRVIGCLVFTFLLIVAFSPLATEANGI